MEFLAGNEKNIIEFILNIEEKDRIALITHSDFDGIVSALLISQILGKIEYLQFIDYSEDMIEKLIPKLKQTKTNKIIITDISIDSKTKGIKELEKLGEILIMDHHPSDKDFNSERISYIKTESKIPTCYLCYLTLSKIQTLEEFGWLVACGILADWCYDKNKKFMDDFMQKMSLDGRIDPDEDIRKTKLWDISCDISRFLIYFNDNMNESFNILNKIKLNNLEQIRKYSDIVQQEIELLSKRFYDERETENYGYYWKFNPKFKIKSYIINSLSSKEESKLFVFATENENILRISFRNQNNNLDCNEVARKSIEGIENAISGGHKNASGATILLKDEEKLKENLRKRIIR
jgi:single-stranded DNA-specific DHH superfamily exonuclease